MTLLTLLGVGGTAVGTPPGYGAGETGNVNTTTIAVTFSEAVQSSDFRVGVVISVNAVPATLVSATRQSDMSVVYYVIGAASDANDVVTWEYDADLGDIADLASNVLADTSAQGVINNVGTHYWLNDGSETIHGLALGAL